MNSAVVTRGNTAQSGLGQTCLGVGLELAEFSGLGSGDLVKLALQAEDARRQLDGYVAALLARLGELEGQDAVEELCRQFGLGRRRARQQARAAKNLKALPDTLEAARQGWISLEHARLVAESHERAPLSQDQELELIALAVSEDLDVFKKKVDRFEDQRHEDGGLSRRERQYRRRRASVFDGEGGMVIVYAELERLAGERVKASLNALNDRMFRHDARVGSDRTFEQRNADALVALITQQPGKTGKTGRKAHDDRTDWDRVAGHTSSEGYRTEGDTSSEGDTVSDSDQVCEPDPQATTLVVTVDYDTLSGQLQNAGLIDGTPISIDELRLIACDAGVVPAIFATDGQPLYVGRKQRAATSAQKLALGVRDKQCIGCAMRASACDAHHIIWWEHGGTTDMANLVLLCPKCHGKVHKHGYQVTATPNGQNRLEPPKRRSANGQPRGPTDATAA